MVNINMIMKQAQAMQKKMVEMQEKMANTEFSGTAGGGMVQVTITGKYEMRNISIDPSLLSADDKEMIEDLIVAAYNDAKKKVDADTESSTSGLMGNLGLPAGFKMPF